MNDMLDPLSAEEPYPLQRMLGFRIVEWADGYARLELPIADHLMNRYGIPHGGVHATLIDTALGYSGSFTGTPDVRQLAMTLSLTVNYLSQPKGKLLICEGRRTGGGRKTFFAEGVLFDDTGERIATGNGVLRYRTGS